MPKHLPALAARAAVAATVTAAAVAAVLPATIPAAAPAATISQTVPVPVVSAPVVPVALAAPTRTALRLSAMNTALGKVGAPYRWGAAGPSAFDCSGLVTWSFAQAGIPLPRTSRAQSTVGTPVSRADLQPGDLVFFYTPVSHVAIYIGGGKIVYSSTSGSPVKISTLGSMPFNSARRV